MGLKQSPRLFCHISDAFLACPVPQHLVSRLIQQAWSTDRIARLVTNIVDIPLSGPLKEPPPAFAADAVPQL